MNEARESSSFYKVATIGKHLESTQMLTLFCKNLRRIDTCNHADKMNEESSPTSLHTVGLKVKYKASYPRLQEADFYTGMASTKTAAESPFLLYSTVPAAWSKTCLQRCYEVKEEASATSRVT